MPRLAGHDEVERATPRVPGLERGDLDAEAVASRDRGHPHVGLDAEHRAAAGREQTADLARAAPDIEDVVATLREEIVDQRCRVARTGPVVLLGVIPEGTRPATIVVQHDQPRAATSTSAVRRLRTGHSAATPIAAMPSTVTNPWTTSVHA